MKNKILIVAALLFTVTVTAQPLDKEMCRKMALENNKKLTIASIEKEQSEFDIKTYRSNFFPKLSASGNYLVTTGSIGMTLAGGYLPILNADGIPVLNQSAFMPDIKMDVEYNNSYMVGVNLKQPIYMGGKIRAANSVAKLANKIANANIRKTTDEIVVESDQAYWQYVKVRELVIVATKYQSVIEELIRNVKNAVEVGMTSNNTLLMAQTKLNEAKLMVRKAENRERLARMNLCHVIGLEIESMIEVKDLTDEKLIKPVFIGDDVNSRAEVEMLSKQVEIAGEQIRLARSEFLPKIGIMGGYGVMGGPKINGDAIDTDGSFTALASVSIPIFTWGEGRNRVRSAEAKQKIAQLQKDDFQQLFRLEANRSFVEFEEAYYRVELTNESIVAATENMRISKDNYETQMGNLADYLEAQTMWQEAWSEYIDAKAMFQLGKTYYLKSIGKLH